MPPLDFYKNLICKDSWHQADVRGSPRLMLLSLIFKTPSADAANEAVRLGYAKRINLLIFVLTLRTVIQIPVNRSEKIRASYVAIASVGDSPNLCLIASVVEHPRPQLAGMPEPSHLSSSAVLGLSCVP